TYHRLGIRVLWTRGPITHRYEGTSCVKPWISNSLTQFHFFGYSVPPYVPATVITVVVAFLSDRLRWRGPFILICLPIAIAGYILAIVATTNTARYAAVFLMATGVYPSGPCILSILPNNSSGHFKKATTTALQLAIANCGGFVATFAYTQDQAPKYIKGHSIALAFLCLAWVLIAANVLYCTWENKARAEGRRQNNLIEYQELYESGKTRAPIGDRHPDFRFTL
ncbi:major facilitator superfamily transporter, partial [Moniliophthora roreri MCA 2997]